MTRLAVVERAISDAPRGGVSLADIAAQFVDGGPRQVAPLAWWLAHTGRVEMSRDCTRWRPCRDKCPTCGTPTVPSPRGHPSLCLPCTEAEIGETYEQVRDRATANVQGHARKKWVVSGGGRRR